MAKHNPALFVRVSLLQEVLQHGTQSELCTPLNEYRAVCHRLQFSSSSQIGSRTLLKSNLLGQSLLRERTVPCVCSQLMLLQAISLLNLCV